MIETEFDLRFIAELARREKQIQQFYRPHIQVHKWFARRPGTLFRGLLLAEYGQRPVAEAFYDTNEFQGLLIADPFMGGGTPLIEANRVGCNVIGRDINPMSYWIVREQIEPLDLSEYDRAVAKLRAWLEEKIGDLYRTTCVRCGAPDASVKYFLWVKTQHCSSCQSQLDLFPGYLVARKGRHTSNVVVCSVCGALNEVEDVGNLGRCSRCGSQLQVSGPAADGICECPECGQMNPYPAPEQGPPQHRMFALEYHCPHCSGSRKGRLFKAPDDRDLERYQEAARRLRTLGFQYAPCDKIPTGDETNRLHRWGYYEYRQMFNARQLLGLQMSCHAITRHADARVRAALSTNLSDLLRYQNMLCRYDTRALKSLDIFSVHGFPVGLVQCESNLIGIRRGKRTNVGSGGWSNIATKYAAAKAYCSVPYEIRREGGKNRKVQIPGESIGRGDGLEAGQQTKGMSLSCGSSADLQLPEGILDGVFTDPPYLGNVQYAELMDFCYVWLRQLVPEYSEAFSEESTRSPLELTANEDMERGLVEYADALSEVFRKMSASLKQDAPLVFTYHHNSVSAYYPIAVAILDAGLTCTASIPCPAEMQASIHINGTGSSVVDTVFVCREAIPSGVEAVGTVSQLRCDILNHVEDLRASGLDVSAGDLKCLVYGHLTRLVVQRLFRAWSRDRSIADKLKTVSSEFATLPTAAAWGSDPQLTGG